MSSKKAINLLRRAMTPPMDPVFSDKKTVDNTTFTGAGVVASTLTAAQSGTHFNINGTDDKTVDMPALSTSNVGLHYSFTVTTATASGKTIKFDLPGSGVSNWYATIFQAGSGSEPSVDVDGDVLTLIQATAIGTHVEILCIEDDGTNSNWKAIIHADTLSTVADG